MSNLSPLFECFSKNNLLKFGKNSFLIGTIFLPSALPISAIFFLISSLIAVFYSFNILIKDKTNILLLIISGLMIFSNFRYLLNKPNEYIFSASTNIWIDLVNWIPLFLCFWGFQSYIKSENDRKLLANTLLISTVPVIFSCIGQFWFKIYGPFSALNGLVIWFQREPAYYSVTGLFNNPNYAGFWLACILPFATFALINKKNNFFLFTYLALITYFLLLTNSRNALLGLLISIPILLGTKFLIIILFIIFFIFALFWGLNNIFDFNEEIIGNIVPLRLIKKVTNLKFAFFINLIRLDGFAKAINLIKMRPLLGWGASTFPIMYLASGGNRDTQHIHNINLEIAYNYGIPISLLITSLVSIIVIKSFKLIFFKIEYSSLINKAWFASTVVVLIYNLTDIPYYDGKFSLISWILLAGLKSINDDFKYINQKVLAKNKC